MMLISEPQNHKAAISFKESKVLLPAGESQLQAKAASVGADLAVWAG